MSARSVSILGFSIAVLFGTGLSAQSTAASAWNESQVPAWTAARRAYDATDRPITTSEERFALSSTSPPLSGIVTVHQLQHESPAEAVKEWEKGERARLKNQIAKAIGHFQRAVEIDPEMNPARTNLGALYLFMEKPEAAIEVLEPAVRTDPHNPTPFSNLAIAYMMLNRLDAAEHAARQTVDLDRVGARSRMLLGLVLTHRKKFTNEALQCFQKAESEYPQAHLLSGQVLAGMGRLSEAKSELNIYLNSGDPVGRDLAEQWMKTISTAEQSTSAARRP